MTPPWWLRSITIEASAVLLALLVLTDAVTPLRTLVAFWFLLVCPGWAWVQLLRVGDSWATACISIALSLALDVGLGLTLFYTGHASARLWLAILIVISLVGVAITVWPEADGPSKLKTSTPSPEGLA